MSSVRETFPPFDSPPSAPSAFISVNTVTTAMNDGAVRQAHTVAPLEASAHRSTTNTTIAHLQKVTSVVKIVKANAGASVALILGVIGLAAAIEDHGCLVQLSELGNGLIGLVCAGGVVLGVVALNNIADGVGVGVEGAWGTVWRWVKDRVSGSRTSGGVGHEEMEVEMEEVMMFDEEGRSAFLLDKPSMIPPSMQSDYGSSLTVPATPPPQQSSERGSPRKKAGRPSLPAFTFPPLPEAQPLYSPPPPRRQEYGYASSSSSSSGSSTQPALNHPVPHRRIGYDVSNPLHHQIYPDSNHASGLLGPSPMPPCHTAQQEWKHFTGQGFYKYRQKLEAVGEWSNPGSSKSLEDVMEKIEEVNERDRREDDP